MANTLSGAAGCALAFNVNVDVFRRCYVVLVLVDNGSAVFGKQLGRLLANIQGGGNNGHGHFINGWGEKLNRQSVLAVWKLKHVQTQSG